MASEGSNIDMQGIVLDLIRGKPGDGPPVKHFIEKENLVTLVLETEGGVKKVDIPIKTEQDYEIIPYQSALIGEELRYTKKYIDLVEEGVEVGLNEPRYSIEIKLTIQSGSLKGKVYEFNE